MKLKCISTSIYMLYSTFTYHTDINTNINTIQSCTV